MVLMALHRLSAAKRVGWLDALFARNANLDLIQSRVAYMDFFPTCDAG